jgi:hypothetical protein
MGSDRDDARSRATKRHDWPVRRYPLASAPSDDLSDRTTPEQRLAMMWPLAIEAWSLTGQPIPDYSRSEMPIVRSRRQGS